MPRFLPRAIYTALPALPLALTAGVAPQKILERNPRRLLAYLRNLNGAAGDVIVSGNLAPQEPGSTLTIEGSGIHVPDETFAFAHESNPLVLNYAGLLAAVGANAGSPQQLSVAELVDDVDHAIEEPLQFRSRFFTSNELVPQGGPDFQPIKVFETEPGLRFLHITAQAGDIALVGMGTPFRLSQGFRLPTSFPLFFRHPFVPSRSLFAADVSGGGGRMRVVSGAL